MVNTKTKLRQVILKFLSQSEKTLEVAENKPDMLQIQDLDLLADKIQAMRQYAMELLNENLDESTWYNASIIKELLDEPLYIEGKKEQISLFEAANLVKSEKNDTILRLLLQALTVESDLKEVLFENLEQISSELSA